MCISPILTKYKRYTDGCEIYNSVPCGRCIECTNKYSLDWSNRLVHESKNWKNVDFLTLTYDEKNCPRIPIITACYCNSERSVSQFLKSPINKDFKYSPNLDIIRVTAVDCVVKVRELLRNHHQLATNYCKRYDIYSDLYQYVNPKLVNVNTLVPFADISDVQNWLKKARQRYFRKYGKRMLLKYFICTEYGAQSFRPHYHVVLMHNEKLEDIVGFFSNSWQLGNVDASYSILTGSNIQKVAKYVAKYCSKSEEFENPYIVAGILPKCKRLMSKGLAANWREELLNIVSNPPQDLQIRHVMNNPIDYNWDLFCGFTYEYLQWLHQHLQILYPSGNLGSVPRYVSSYIFPIRYVYRYQKNSNSFVCKVVKVLDSESELRKAYKNFIQFLFVQNDLARQSNISKTTGKSIFEASYLQTRESLVVHRSRSDAAKSKYARSVFKQFV